MEQSEVGLEYGAQRLVDSTVASKCCASRRPPSNPADCAWKVERMDVEQRADPVKGGLVRAEVMSGGTARIGKKRSGCSVRLAQQHDVDGSRGWPTLV
eukprot:scaffold10560_cov133-Isochrysis_galbana.AAC.8